MYYTFFITLANEPGVKWPDSTGPMAWMRLTELQRCARTWHRQYNAKEAFQVYASEHEVASAKLVTLNECHDVVEETDLL